MCGIAGLWTGNDETSVRVMMEALRHRGPDACGVYKNEHGVLGHQRLSIMDPTGGNQPIFNETGDLAIIANGEMYNYPTLRTELQKRHRLATGNDSESALHLYEEVREETAEHLDGMWAFAIADAESLYLARDPIGIKPLYTGRRGDALVFGSELKALSGIATDVTEFPAGSWFHTEAGTKKFYDVPDHAPTTLSVEEHCRRIRETLERAVVKRLMSDVPVGAFLSGGLDSSIIAALARKHLDELHTFSVGIEGSRDLEAARFVSKHLDTIHHEYFLTEEEIREKLPEIVYHLESFDQDLVRSAIPCYFTSRLAAKHLKVILTGEGADELFAGYTYYRDIENYGVLHKELRRSVQTLHNINLQRVDRLTMAHSLEARVPFLDTDLVDVGLRVPPELKLYRHADGQVIEKWILRKACEDLLPREIVWRDKEQFDEGSGTVDIVGDGLDHILKGRAAAAYAEDFAEAELRSPEECAYHKLLSDAYSGSEVVLDNVARWSFRDEALT